MLYCTSLMNKYYELLCKKPLKNTQVQGVRFAFTNNNFASINTNETPLRVRPAPSRIGYSSWIAFLKENFKKMSGNIKDITKQCSNLWKTMSQEERQVYRDLSLQSKLQAMRTYEHWVTSLSPKEIIQENRIRKQLRKQGKKGVLRIKDPRKPKRPMTPFFLYCAYARSCPNFIESYVDGARKPTQQVQALSRKWTVMEDKEKEILKVHL
ncbi:hypothetical protein PCANB_000788 [Pneumocystis canis]|nr:hypothetical protein PCANB_000788 [Pneumocystis canis]